MKTIILSGLLSFSFGSICQTTWYEIPTGTNERLNTIFFASSSVGYIGGNDSLLLKTTNGGQTWTELNLSGVGFSLASPNIVELYFVSESIGFMTIGPFGGGVYKTTDGGLNWTFLTPEGTYCVTEGLYFFDDQTGFIGGAGCFQGETIDQMNAGVLTNTVVNFPTGAFENVVADFDFLNPTVGLAAAYSGQILRTDDGGDTWDTIPTGLADGVPVTSVTIVSATEAYAGYDDLGSGFGVLKSTDGGLSWAMDVGSATFYYPSYYGAHTSEQGHVYFGGTPSFGDGGLIFELDNTPTPSWFYYDVEEPIYDVHSYNDSIVFAVGDSGYVVTNSLPGNLGTPDYTISAQVELEVFPNPVKNELSLNYDSEEFSSNPIVVIQDMAGNIVYRQSTTTNLDVSFLPAGVYMLTVQSDQMVSRAERFIKN